MTLRNAEPYKSDSMNQEKNKARDIETRMTFGVITSFNIHQFLLLVFNCLSCRQTEWCFHSYLSNGEQGSRNLTFLSTEILHPYLPNSCILIYRLYFSSSGKKEKQ